MENSITNKPLEAEELYELAGQDDVGGVHIWVVDMTLYYKYAIAAITDITEEGVVAVTGAGQNSSKRPFGYYCESTYGTEWIAFVKKPSDTEINGCAGSAEGASGNE